MDRQPHITTVSNTSIGDINDTLSKEAQLTLKIMEKFQDSICIVLEPHPGTYITYVKTKYIIPYECTLGQFHEIAQNMRSDKYFDKYLYLHLSTTQSLVATSTNEYSSSSYIEQMYILETPMRDIWETYRSSDYMLHLIYSENKILQPTKSWWSWLWPWW